MTTSSTPQDFLLEIGCEELPADYLPNVLDWNHPQPHGLASAATHVLSEAKVIFRRVETFATPRRLVLKVLGVEAVVREEIEGPPVSIAFAPDGKPTPAAEGFAKKQGISVSQLRRKNTAKGERLVLERQIPVEKVLADAVPKMISGIAFPKTMRWDSSGVRFARPVRWLLSLYGSKPLSCSYGTVKSAAVTYPNRRFPQKPVKISSIAGYFSVLPKLKVQLEHGLLDDPTHSKGLERIRKKKKGLLQQLNTAAAKLGGRLQDETTEEFEWLLNTVTFLAEDPVVAVGSFQKVYLELPTEVLATSMAKHLKLFSLREKESERLLPNFLAVLEGKPAKPAMVMANYDRIIEARFTDAKFFYREDTKQPFQANVSKLGKVAFYEKLGTVEERALRLAGLMKGISSQITPPADAVQLIPRAALLCKADLVTQMVREFPSLQGIIGGYYAHGEPELVRRAISEHYQPRAAKDPVPTTSLGALLSLADRVDALVGYFGVGLKPTGSADPYGLRRQALGLVRILIEPPKGASFVGLSFDRLFDVSIQSWGARLTVDPKTLKRDLRAFLRERFEWQALREAPADDRGGTVPAAEEVPQRGCAAARELVAAVLTAGDDDLAGAWERLQVLRRLWAGSGDEKRKTLEAAAKVAERTGRIVKSVKDLQLSDAVDPAILKEPEEKELWETWNRIAPQVKEHLERRQYEEATKIYSALYPAVHTYFEKVFVMAEDEGLRRNRLALLKQIHGSLASAFADLARLPLPGTLEN